MPCRMEKATGVAMGLRASDNPRCSIAYVLKSSVTRRLRQHGKKNDSRSLLRPSRQPNCSKKKKKPSPPSDTPPARATPTDTNPWEPIGGNRHPSLSRKFNLPLASHDLSTPRGFYVAFFCSYCVAYDSAASNSSEILTTRSPQSSAVGRPPFGVTV